MAKVYEKRGTQYLWCTGRDAAGQRWWESTNQTDPRAAKLAASQIEREKILGTHRPKQSTVTLEDGLIGYLEYQEAAGREESTSRATTYHARHLVSTTAFSKTTLLESIELPETSAYVKCRLEQDASRHTIKKEVIALIAAMKRQAKLGTIKAKDWKALMPDEIAKDVYKPRERYLGVEEDEELMAELEQAAKEHRTSEDRTDYMIMYTHVGVRFDELFRVQPEHYQPKTHPHELLVDGTKTDGAKRMVPLTEAAEEVLARRIERARKEGGPVFPVWHKMVRDLAAACERIEARRNPEYHALAHERRREIVQLLEGRRGGAGGLERDHIAVALVTSKAVATNHLRVLVAAGIVRDLGDEQRFALDRDGYRAALRAVGGELDAPRPRAPFPPVTANDLRRTFCSRLCQRGVSEQVCAKLMGHADTTMVRAVYGHLDRESLHQAVRGTHDHSPRPTVTTRGENLPPLRTIREIALPKNRSKIA